MATDDTDFLDRIEREIEEIEREISLIRSVSTPDRFLNHLEAHRVSGTGPEEEADRILNNRALATQEGKRVFPVTEKLFSGSMLTGILSPACDLLKDRSQSVERSEERIKKIGDELSRLHEQLDAEAIRSTSRKRLSVEDEQAVSKLRHDLDTINIRLKELQSLDRQSLVPLVQDFSMAKSEYGCARHAAADLAPSDYGLKRYIAYTVAVFGLDALINFVVFAAIIHILPLPAAVLALFIALFFTFGSHVAGGVLKKDRKAAASVRTRKDDPGKIPESERGHESEPSESLLHLFFWPLSMTKGAYFLAFLLAFAFIIGPRLALFDSTQGLFPDWSALTEMGNLFTDSPDTQAQAIATNANEPFAAATRNTGPATTPDLAVDSVAPPFIYFVGLLFINAIMAQLGVTNSYRYHHALPEFPKIKRRYEKAYIDLEKAKSRMRADKDDIEERIRSLLTDRVGQMTDISRLQARVAMLKGGLDDYNYSTDSNALATAVTNALIDHRRRLVDRLRNRTIQLGAGSPDAIEVTILTDKDMEVDGTETLEGDKARREERRIPLDQYIAGNLAVTDTDLNDLSNRRNEIFLIHNRLQSFHP